MMYAYSENFVLPFSHDEVVHLKHSLLGRMPGDDWQRFANLRLLYTYQWTYPGKKLLFMGGEFAQPTEWDFRVASALVPGRGAARARACAGWSAISIGYTASTRHCRASNSSRAASAGSIARIARTRC